MSNVDEFVHLGTFPDLSWITGNIPNIEHGEM